MADVKISRRQAGKIRNLPSSKRHQIRVKTKYTCHMLEVEDVNFHHDSAVLLPDYGPFKPQEGTTEEQDRVTGLAVLYACYRHVREHPDQAALVVGHTDRSGPSDYNQTLSEMRADGVLAALQGERGAWVGIAEEKSKVEDYQQILIWLTHSLGWNCDPGKKDNIHGPKTQQAVEDFQDQYEKKFKVTIPPKERGKVGPATWGGFFDVYMQELQFALGTDANGLREVQQSIRFTGCGAIGCGERHPITPKRKENYKTPIDRRVEILFFDPGEEPPSGDDCTKPESTCEELYKDGIYKVTPIPVEPLPVPSGLAVHVMLELLYKDPEEPTTKTRAFPEGFLVTVAYADGTHEEKSLGKDGALEFFAPREKKSFTLRFETDPPQYVASPSPRNGSGGPDEVISAGAVQEKQRQGYRMFMLPVQTWGLADSWAVSGAATYNPDSHQFERLEDASVTKIGSAAKPATLVLDPHWQYLKFVYHDRLLKKTLRLPPLMIEGASDELFLDLGTPDTQSNWSIDRPHGCQCLPWILQDPPMPGKDAVIQFRTEENTFIESFDNGARRLVKVKPKSSNDTINPFADDPDVDGAEPETPPDPGLNLAQEVTVDILTPGPDRLRFYDLPAIWKSRTYHARLLKGPSSNEAAKRGAFEALVEEKTTPETPLMFSLDDMVLMKHDGGKLEPVAWKPEDRVAIFAHTFAKDGHPECSAYGLYDPDSTERYLTKKPSAGETTRNYIADYPDWTRLVIAQGLLYDVFYQRTPDGDEGVVGARAAVQIRESTGPAPGNAGSGGGASSFFYDLEPFTQRHDRGTFGRFDLMLLRCCDVHDGKETAVVFQYFRYHYDFSDPELPAALRTNKAKQIAFGDTAAHNIIRRWNGPDGPFNPGPAEILPEDPNHPLQEDSSRKLRVLVTWFVQVMVDDVSKAHFEIEVKKDVRAFMNMRGKGAMEPAENEPDNKGKDQGAFTAAHESGHAGSLDDEYIETSRKASYYAPGFDSFSPGAPYFFDEKGMMRGNKEVRGRYFWHVAQWLRKVDKESRSKIDQRYFVRHGKYRYRLPHHAKAPKRSYISYPLEAHENVRRGSRGRKPRGLYDWYLYALGADRYSQEVLVPGHTLDGIMVVVVKMKFTFHTDDFDDIIAAVYAIKRKLNKAFNGGKLGSSKMGRWYVTGEYGTKGTPTYRNFDKCALLFSPRFLVTNFPDDEKDAEEYAEDVGVHKTKAGSDDFDMTASKNAYDKRVSNIESATGGVFEVEVKKGGFFEGKSATWVSTRNLRIVYNTSPFSGAWYAQAAELLRDEFPRMLGINKEGGAVSASDLLPIARTPGPLMPRKPVLPNAKVHAF